MPRHSLKPLSRLSQHGKTQLWTTVKILLGYLNILLSLCQNFLSLLKCSLNSCWSLISMLRHSFKPLSRLSGCAKTQFWASIKTLSACHNNSFQPLSSMPRLLSSSSVVTPSALHSYVKRRFSGPPFSPALRQWEVATCFLREWSELSLDSFFGMVFYPPSHPPTREGNWSHCSEYLSWLDRVVDFIALDSSSWSREVGGGWLGDFLGDGPKIF